jgi:cytochrome c oxidase subunit II
VALESHHAATAIQPNQVSARGVGLKPTSAKRALSVAAATLMAHAGKAAFAISSPDPANIFRPRSTPADEIHHLSLFVLATCAAIFITVFSLLVYAVVKFRRREDDDGREPAQIYGSNQVELAWTVIPVLIVVVLFLAAARVTHAVEDAKMPPGATEVVAVGHQFWWEFRYPVHGFVTANELHVPVSEIAGHERSHGSNTDKADEEI